MNILITGGNGYIAKHLSSYFGYQHTVLSPGKDKLNCLDPIQITEFFQNNIIDVVIHTALTGREELFSNDEKFYKDAMSMWNNIRDHHMRYKKLIHFGSAYDTFDNPYGRAKSEIAEFCKNTENFYNLRLFGNFHVSEKNNRFFKKLFNSDRFVIAENKKFDYLHLEDLFPVVDFVINESPKERSFDVVYKEKRTLISQAMEFCVLNDVKTVIEVQNEGADLIGDSTTIDSFNLKLQGLTAGFKKYRL